MKSLNFEGFFLCQNRMFKLFPDLVNNADVCAKIY